MKISEIDSTFRDLYLEHRAKVEQLIDLVAGARPCAGEDEFRIYEFKPRPVPLLAQVYDQQNAEIAIKGMEVRPGWLLRVVWSGRKLDYRRFTFWIGCAGRPGLFVCQLAPTLGLINAVIECLTMRVEEEAIV